MPKAYTLCTTFWGECLHYVYVLDVCEPYLFASLIRFVLIKNSTLSSFSASLTGIVLISINPFFYLKNIYESCTIKRAVQK